MHWGEIKSLLFCAGTLTPLFRDRFFIKAAVCRVGKAIVPGVYGGGKMEDGRSLPIFKKRLSRHLYIYFFISLEITVLCMGLKNTQLFFFFGCILHPTGGVYTLGVTDRDRIQDEGYL